MINYKGQKCPVCDNIFKNDEDIVVCPVCGAPHHRECYRQNGHCKFEDLHGTSQQWNPQPAEKNKEEIKKICSRCGNENDANALVCSLCANPLEPPKDREPFTGFGGGPFGGFIFNFDALGGVSPNEKIEGIPVADVATCVGSNSHYYIPKFKFLERTKSKISWNWAAFFIPHLWLFFRKCYLQGFLAFTVNISIVSVIQWFFILIQDVTGPVDAFDPSLVNKLSNDDYLKILPYLGVITGAFFLLLINNLIWGLFGNHIYKSVTVEKVKAVKQQVLDFGADTQEQIMLLSSKGGINFFLPALIYLSGTGLVNFFLSIIQR